MNNLFNSVKGVRPKRNAFNFSHKRTFTCNMGQLIPVFTRDVIPNSTWSVSTHELTRFQSLLAPIMDEVNAYIHFWYLPYRLLDNEFNDWIFDHSNDTYDPPYYTWNDVEASCQSEACELLRNLYTCNFSSENADSEIHITARPLQAYVLLVKTFYSNEYVTLPSSLSSAIDQILDFPNGNISTLVANFLNGLYNEFGIGHFPHAWSKDYFTSALPYVQKGDPVTISLADSAPVVQNNLNFTIDGLPTGSSKVIGLLTSSSTSDDAPLYSESPTGTKNAFLRSDGAGSIEKIIGRLPEGELSADLSEASSISINEFRFANALQVFKERLMRFGSKYYEGVKGFFNQNTSDARMFIPQWLGGGKLAINISDIEQTSATANSSTTGATTPLGTLAGKGTAFGSGFAGFTRHFEEHGIIIGLLFIQPKASYCQGLNKDWTKLNDRYDFFNPSFEHLGEQEIKKHELFFSGNDKTNNSTFGYTPRYAEYKHWDNEVAGQFRDTLAFWTLVRKFDSAPSLNSNFIYTQYAETVRPFAVQEVSGKPIDHCLNELYFEVKAVLPMSKYGTPMLLN